MKIIKKVLENTNENVNPNIPVICKKKIGKGFGVKKPMMI
jgi:hypothetical protein